MIEPIEELESIMQETPVGENFGRSKKEWWPEFDEEDVQGLMAHTLVRHLNLLSHQSSQATHMIIPTREQNYYGMKAHRGVLTEDEYEYLDWDVVEDLVEYELGCDLVDLAEIYGEGRPGGDRLRRRDIMDARLLAIQERGGNMTVLAAVFGWRIRDNGECRMMSKALARAKAVHAPDPTPDPIVRRDTAHGY